MLSHQPPFQITVWTLTVWTLQPGKGTSPSLPPSPSPLPLQMSDCGVHVRHGWPPPLPLTPCRPLHTCLCGRGRAGNRDRGSPASHVAGWVTWAGERRPHPPQKRPHPPHLIMYSCTCQFLASSPPLTTLPPTIPPSLVARPCWRPAPTGPSAQLTVCWVLRSVSLPPREADGERAVPQGRPQVC